MAKSASQHPHQPPTDNAYDGDLLLTLPMASTAGKLKYADPRSLPSYPSAGLSSSGAAASAAASLGWSNQKPVKPWRPDKASSASAAAVLAKDYKMSPAWEPTSDGAGAKAAILAVGSADTTLKKPNMNKPSEDSWGNSAATQAFHANHPPSAVPINLSHGNSAATQAFNTNRSQSTRKTGQQPNSQGDRSLVAAKGAMSSSKHAAMHSLSESQSHSRESHPTDASASSISALNGAAVAHRASMNKSPLKVAGAVSVTTMTRNMFTSHPPIKSETDEKTKTDRLHQVAVEMAKKMYQQQKRQDEATNAHEVSGYKNPSPYFNLQDVAYKQAQERLSKLQDEHYKNRQYQEYYGNEKLPRRRFSAISKLHRRSSSDGDIADRERSEKIREQMSLFSSQLSQVDKDKREKDREALLAAAQRNVKARLQGMDEKIYLETGKINATMMSGWEIKAQQAAQSRHESWAEGKSKIDIGGGRFMDTDEVDAIAAKRVQPVLDDIHEKAEVERERLALFKMEDEVRRSEMKREKARERELKEIQKLVKEEDKQQDKVRKLQERQDEKVKKEEQRRLSKRENPRSKEDAVATNQENESEGEEMEDENRNAIEANASSVDPTLETTTESVKAGSPCKASEEPTSPTSRVKSWIKNRFSRGNSFGEQSEKQKSFVGGLPPKEPGVNGSIASLEHRVSSMCDVALAGRVGGHEVCNNDENANQDSRGVSPVSSLSEDDSVCSRRMNLEPPRPIGEHASRSSSSPTRDPQFREILDR